MRISDWSSDVCSSDLRVGWGWVSPPNQHHQEEEQTAMEGQARKKIRNDQRQRALRRNATDTEHKLWESLRSRQIDGAKFRRQHPFGDYILDFACLERRVVVELDGGQHAETTRYDRERTRVLE